MFDFVSIIVNKTKNKAIDKIFHTFGMFITPDN